MLCNAEYVVTPSLPPHTIVSISYSRYSLSEYGQGSYCKYSQYSHAEPAPADWPTAAPLGGHTWVEAGQRAARLRLGTAWVWGGARPVRHWRGEQKAVHTVLVCVADEHDRLLEAAAEHRRGDEERAHLHGCGGQWRRRQREELRAHGATRGAMVTLAQQAALPLTEAVLVDPLLRAGARARSDQHAAHRLKAHATDCARLPLLRRRLANRNVEFAANRRWRRLRLRC